MPIKFNPRYSITPRILKALLRIEAVKERVIHLPINPVVLKSLRETARLYTTHYSTMIEGNVLNPEQIKVVLEHKGHFPGRERDEHEVKGYYTALTQIEKWVMQEKSFTEELIQTIHALVMAHGRITNKPTRYRDGQNVIRDGKTKALVYLPPEAIDVQPLMDSLISWITNSTDLACPLVAAIVHYQFATIHPYYDGNGRTARLLTTFILHRGGYSLKGLYSLEEYYAQNLGAYYEALTIGDSHNYYMGRAEADISSWIEYFLEGMALSYERVLERMLEAQTKGLPNQSALLRTLDPRQRKALELFLEYDVITSRQIGDLFGCKPRTSASLCASWAKDGFLVIVDSSNKGRKYGLATPYISLLT